MSEWGNPARDGHFDTNKIVYKERTQGTETSKYLQERKSRETPRVVASEIGPANKSSDKNRKRMGRRTKEGDSPVGVESWAMKE